MTTGQFQKGQSGNPKGRPRKGGKSDNYVSAIFDQTFTVKQDGVERTLTAEEVLQLRVVDHAMKGKHRAIAQVIGMILEREAWRAANQSPRRSRQPNCKIIIERDSDNAFEAMHLLGIAIKRPWYLRNCDKYDPDDPGNVEPANYDRMTLVKWAVDAALARGHDLSDDDLCCRLQSFVYDPSQSDRGIRYG